MKSFELGTDTQKYPKSEVRCLHGHFQREFRTLRDYIKQKYPLSYLSATTNRLFLITRYLYTLLRARLGATEKSRTCEYTDSFFIRRQIRECRGARDKKGVNILLPVIDKNTAQTAMKEEEEEGGVEEKEGAGELIECKSRGS